MGHYTVKFGQHSKKRYREPQWLIINETAPAIEAEILIAITIDVATIRHVLIIGDKKQLRTVITTARLMKKSSVGTQEFSDAVCTFEAQMSMTLQQRLQVNVMSYLFFSATSSNQER